MGDMVEKVARAMSARKVAMEDEETLSNYSWQRCVPDAGIAIEACHFGELVEALGKAHHELNAIRARDGAPLCIQWGPNGPMQSFQVSEEYFNELVDECHAVLAKVEATDA